MFDKTGKGKIDFADFKTVAKELGENMSAENMKEMFAHADQGDKGFVSFDDFFKLMKKRSAPAAIDDLLGEDED